MANQALTDSQVADDHGFEDASDRVKLPDGRLVFVYEDPLGNIYGYRTKLCVDYGGNELRRISADETSRGLCHGFRIPTMTSYRNAVARLEYAGRGPSGTGTSRYRVAKILKAIKEPA